MKSGSPHPLLSELKTGLAPSSDQARLLAERLGKSLGTPLAPPLVPAAPIAASVVAATKTALGIKVLLGLLIAGGAGFAITTATTGPHQENAARVATRRTTVPAASSPRDEAPPVEAFVAPPTAAPAPASPSLPATPHASPRPRAVEPAQASNPGEPAQASNPGEPAQASNPGEPAPGSADAARAEERALIDEARRALLGNDGAKALTSLARHRERFPQGTLREEREALGVSALAAAGRTTEARAARSRFEASWPRSLFLSNVRAAAP